MEFSYELVGSQRSISDREAGSESDGRPRGARDEDMTPSCANRTEFHFHSPQLDDFSEDQGAPGSPLSLAFSEIDTSALPSPIYGASDVESLEGLILPRLDYRDHSTAGIGVQHEPRRQRKLRAFIVGSTASRRAELREAIAKHVVDEDLTSQSLVGSSQLRLSSQSTYSNLAGSFIRLDQILAHRIPQHLLPSAQAMLLASASEVFNHIVLAVLEEPYLPETMESLTHLQQFAAIIPVIANTEDIQNIQQELAQRSISIVHLPRSDSDTSFYVLPQRTAASASSLTDASSTPLAVAHSPLGNSQTRGTTPQLSDDACITAIHRETVRKFLLWRITLQRSGTSENASTPTDDPLVNSQTGSFTGYAASQEDMGSEEDAPKPKARHVNRRRSDCNITSFPAPGFDPLLIGMRPMFSVGLDVIGTWTRRIGLWSNLTRFACVCSSVIALGCFFSWGVAA